MNPSDSRTRHGLVRRAARAAALASLVAACTSTTTVGFGTLDGATVGDVENLAPNPADLRIVRDGAARPAQVGMEIQKGDTIATSRTARALITFRAGYEVTLDTATSIVVENPSILVRFGQVFLRKLGIARDTFPVRTGHVSIVDSSTSFIVKVLRDDSAVVVVDEGVAVVRPRTGTWVPIRYHALQGGTFRGSEPPGRWTPVSREQFNLNLRWVRRVDSLTRVVMPRLDSLSEADARTVLDRAGLKVGEVLSKATGRAAAGTVIDQSPAAGERVARYTRVTFSIESGSTARVRTR
ncbi:MAG: PASTA domain-containing protein [Gemmatimonadota bacterium]